MTNLSAVSTSVPVTPVTTTRNASAQSAASNQSLAQSYTSVTLGGSNAAASAQLYSMSGTAPSTDKTPSWLNKSNDAVSTMMAGNFSSSSLGARFKGLGAALLNRFDSDAGNFSQSVVALPAGTPKGSALETTLRAQTDAQSDNKISLTIVTASGAQVDLTLSNQEDGLSVQVQVSKGKLTDAERGALQKLSDGFQTAIDGIAASPPSLKLDGLTQFDTSLLASVDLHASVQVGGQSQTIDFHADSKQRTVSAAGPAGTLKVSVDLSNLAIVGTAKQQGEAIKRYLKQFDDAQSRGHGDASLVAMFKDAFKEMNSNVTNAAQQARAQSPAAIWLNKADQSMTTGLADFSASMTQEATSPNPARQNENDTFSYQTSQSSNVSGNGQLNRAITQQQESHLSASYHESLLADVPLRLTTDKNSQNYTYHQIKDDASSKATIAYDKGVLVKASLQQSASQSTRVQKYIMGEMISDQTTPQNATLSRDFLDLLKPLQKKEGATSAADISKLDQALATINNLVYLQPDPLTLRSER
ncbi:hypothetical protein [Herbaspirillum sp. NPDC101397]|uniref:hypothetical protein n=1 Tax=Herbaspirillum sp. NPDC101397 TaxID=3364006 RepID=UPI00383B58A0